MPPTKSITNRYSYTGIIAYFSISSWRFVTDGSWSHVTPFTYTGTMLHSTTNARGPILSGKGGFNFQKIKIFCGLFHQNWQNSAISASQGGKLPPCPHPRKIFVSKPTSNYGQNIQNIHYHMFTITNGRLCLLPYMPPPSFLPYLDDRTAVF